jgi:hypothetical protein
MKVRSIASRRTILLVWLALTALAVQASITGDAAQHELVLVDPAWPLASSWERRDFGEPTGYRVVEDVGRAAIEATGTGTAAGLVRAVRFEVRSFPFLEWSWRVDRVPEHADLRSDRADDVGASLSLVFESSGLLDMAPWTLTYAWAAASTPSGLIVASPRHPRTMRTIVLRSDPGDLGTWVSERRDIVEDYRAAFGEDPPAEVRAVALWSDSDQTRDAVLAYYGLVRAVSPGDPEP